MTSRRNKRRKIYGSVFLLGLVLYFLALLWLLPAWIKAPINEQLKQMDLQIDYEQLWINPLTLNIHVTEPKVKNLANQPILSAEKIDIDWQLLPLLNRQIILERIQLNQAHLVLEFSQNNQLIRPVLQHPTTDESGWQFMPQQLEVSNSTVTIKRQNQNLPIKNINLTLNLAELNNPEQSGLIRFETTPDGHVSIEKQGNDNVFQWQINQWPLQQLSPWLQNNDNLTELVGQITASGTLIWPNNQLPIVEVIEANLDVKQFRWSDFTVKNAQIKTENINFNINKKDITIGQIQSSDGQLNIEIDPLNLIEDQNEFSPSDNLWSWQLNTLELSNWAINLQNNRPAVKAHINDIIVNKTGTQQNVSFTFEIQEPLQQPLQITGQGPLDPLQLKGQIKADNLTLESLNPWLSEMTEWQFQETLLTVNSPFCLHENNFYAIGHWYLPKITMINPNQHIEAQQTKLKSIGLNFNQKQITLNGINSDVIEIQSLENQPLENQSKTKLAASNSPQSTQQGSLWQVSIDQNSSERCDIKLR